jgi:hypothetical protein
VHPVLDGARRIAEHTGRFATTDAMSNQQHTVESVVIPSLVRTTDFVLQREDHGFGVRNSQWLHGHNKTQPETMRNYL